MSGDRQRGTRLSLLAYSWLFYKMVESADKHESFEVIIKEGWIEKRSKYVKEWRPRWLVLTPRFLCSFKKQQDYRSSPTEKITLRECSSVKSAEDDVRRADSFRVDTNVRTYFFTARDTAEKEAWIGAIGKIMVTPTVLRTHSEEEMMDGQ